MMSNKKTGNLLKELTVKTVAAILLVVIIISGIGWYLSPQDTLEKTDAIVVVSGGETQERVREGVLLYGQGYSPKIIFSGAALDGSISNARSMGRIAENLGVPGEDIMLEENARNTVENAQFTSVVLKENNFHSIILITSPYHQRRASMTFRQTLGEDFIIINHSAKDSAWRKRAWWANEWAVKITISELAKVFYLTLRGTGV